MSTNVTYVPKSIMGMMGLYYQAQTLREPVPMCQGPRQRCRQTRRFSVVATTRLRAMQGVWVILTNDILLYFCLCTAFPAT